MRRWMLITPLLTAGVGCALWGAPGWVRRGYLICNDRACPGVISGVGRSGPVQNGGLRRDAADANARAEVARAVVNGMHAEFSGRFFMQNSIGVETVDHWEALDGTEYSLATLSLSSLRSALELRSDLTPVARATLEEELAPLFQEPRSP